MAFIRRVRTGSGATAVQIAEYVSGRRQRIVAHLGSVVSTSSALSFDLLAGVYDSLGFTRVPQLMGT